MNLHSVFFLAALLFLSNVYATNSKTASIPLKLGKRRSSRPSLVVLSTLDGAVLGIDASTGNEVFTVRSDAPALSSWAREGYPEYVPTLDGALYRLDPKTGEAVAVDARFIAASNPAAGAAGANARRDAAALANSLDAPQTAGAVVLTAQSTSALSVNLRTGAVVRSLSFTGDANGGIMTSAGEGSAMPNDDIVLLSRTSIGVRVVDAASAEELANATLTHTNPSFLDKGRCLLPGGPSSNTRYTASVSEDRARVVMRDNHNRVVWERRVDSAVVDAHGMGSVMVSAAPAEVEAQRAALPDGGGSEPLALAARPKIDSISPPVNIVVASQGKTRYVVNAPANAESNGELAIWRVRDPWAGIDSLKNPDGTLNGIGVLLMFVVVICLMAGYALGRRPRRRSRDRRRAAEQRANGRQVSSYASFDGMPSASEDEDGDARDRNLRSEDERDRESDATSSRLNKTSSRKRPVRFRKRARSALKSSDADDTIRTNAHVADENVFVPSNESTGSRSSGGVVSSRTESGWLTVGSLEVSQKVLGTGSHGTVVYEGKICPGDRKVAVKRLLRQFFDSARKEIELLVQLDEASPHVVRYHAMEEDSEFIYLALELCAGNLAERVLKREAPAIPEQYVKGPAPFVTIRALRQLLQGLMGLHRAGVVHRDIKPQNVLISRTGANGVADVKLADVGLATKLDANRSSYTAVSNAGGGVGTQGWRAPEVLRSGRQTKAVDIFSAGCVVFFVLTGGMHPFGANSVVRDGNILSDCVFMEPLQELELPEAADIVSKMIDPDAAKRPSAEAALAHPFFWTDAMKLSFLVDVSDRLFDLRSDPARYTEKFDKSAYSQQFCSDWLIGLDMDLLNELGRIYEVTASGILRIIRNKRNHYSELSPELQRRLGPLPEDESSDEMDENGLHSHNFLTYFTSRVPHLLMCTYTYALANPAIIEQPHFTRYGLKVGMYEDSPDLHPMVKKRIDAKNAKNESNTRGSKRYEYSKEFHKLYQRKCAEAPPAMIDRIQELGLKCSTAPKTWASVLERPMTEKQDGEFMGVIEDDEDEVTPPGFEGRPRFINSALPPLPHAGQPSPSLRPRSTLTSPGLRPRAPGNTRGFTTPRSDAPPGFGGSTPTRPEPLSLQDPTIPPYNSPNFVSISSITARRERMAASNASRGVGGGGGGGANGTPNRGTSSIQGRGGTTGTTQHGEGRNIDFGDLARRRQVRKQ